MCANCPCNPLSAPIADMEHALPMEKQSANLAGARMSVGRPTKNARVNMRVPTVESAKNHATLSFESWLRESPICLVPAAMDEPIWLAPCAMCAPSSAPSRPISRPKFRSSVPVEDATLLSSAPAALREVCRDFPKAERSFMSPYSFETFCQSAGRGAEEVGPSAEFRIDSVSAAKDLGAGRWVRDSNGRAPERKDFFSDEPEPDPLIPDPDPTVSRGRARRGVGGRRGPKILTSLLSASKCQKCWQRQLFQVCSKILSIATSSSARARPRAQSASVSHRFERKPARTSHRSSR